ncbi:MerR family transcriptional regulator [Saccharothrix australiensis]|uniref:DNA-binding transcriptional MerR regulator n=1 Tax=Saccharothrix australiensis TaxID=2072 RepID=A0A495VZH5_9PSEU|nr:DNA-binding transcriptional MerR regulator [Saccharothrix australiensis]
MAVRKLDDVDYPAYSTGQAADLLDVQQAFLRSLDTAGLLSPRRSGGGHRRYSRRQLELAARIRVLFDEGHTLAAAARIIGLEDELAAAHDQIARLRTRLAAPDGAPVPDGGAPVPDGGAPADRVPAPGDDAPGPGDRAPGAEEPANNG